MTCVECGRRRGSFLDPDGRHVCGYCWRAIVGRCPTCAKPNADTTCKAYR